MGQSSNDVIPTAIHVSRGADAARAAAAGAGASGATSSGSARRELEGVVKTGRTHLMDAMPRHAWPGTVGLAHADRERQRAPARVRAAAAARWRRAAPRSAPASMRTRSSARRSASELARLTQIPFQPSRKLFRVAVGAGCGRRAVRAAQGHRREPDEDRQRSALDEQRSAGGPGRDRAAGAAARQQHHARQGQSGDPRGHGHGRRAGDRQ